MRRVLASLALTVALLPVPPASAQVVGADLSVSSRADPPASPTGETIRLHATVANGGPEPASDVILTLTLPPALVAQQIEAAPGPCTIDGDVTCRIGRLEPGSSGHVRVLVAVVGGGIATARAAAAGAQDDPLPENDAAVAEVTGKGSSCELVGTVGPDLLRARRRGTVACALGGDDVLLGGPRGDELLGSAGNDILVGDAGHDRLDGGDGTDACAGDPGSGAERRCERRIFALAGSLPLVEVEPDTVGYGYHQSLFATAIGLRPLGEHVVMGSRGRGTGSTTSADVVIPSRARVRAPVTGRVVAVKRYRLYCERPDWKLVIRPDLDPTLRVLVLHLGTPGVEKGDDVVAGVSAIGRASANDWADSQANRYFPDKYPHVHVEVERDRASPTPGCAI